jgi:hypothetical protein
MKISDVDHVLHRIAGKRGRGMWPDVKALSRHRFLQPRHLPDKPSYDLAVRPLFKSVVQVANAPQTVGEGVGGAGA